MERKLALCRDFEGLQDRSLSGFERIWDRLMTGIIWYCTEVLQRKRHQTVVKFTGSAAYLEGQGDLVRR